MAGRGLRFVLATGSRPAAPPVTGLRETGYLTNEIIFQLSELPRQLAVRGGRLRAGPTRLTRTRPGPRPSRVPRYREAPGLETHRCAPKGAR